MCNNFLLFQIWVVSSLLMGELTLNIPVITYICIFVLFFLLIYLHSFMPCTHPQAEKSNSLPSRATAPYIQGIRHLLDDSVLEESPCASSDGSVCSKLHTGEHDRRRCFQSSLITSCHMQVGCGSSVGRARNSW